MELTFRIPDEVIEPLKVPKKQVEKVLIKELSFLLYEKGYASMGIARKVSGLSKWDFVEGLAERGIQRHYDEKDLEEDIRYAKDSK